MLAGVMLIGLMAALFVAAAIVAVIIALVARPQRVSGRVALILAPFAVAMLPVAAIALVIAANALLQKSDRALFAEIYGFTPDAEEWAILSDDFGVGSNRRIYMRIEPSPHDRQRILAVARHDGALTAQIFAAAGAAEQFMWWDTQCEAPALYMSDGYRDWRLLAVLDCPERRQMFLIARRP